MLQKWYALFIVEDFSSLLKEKRQLAYLLVANWGIAKAIHKYSQESTRTLWQHMMHMYIRDNLIIIILEGMQNGITKAELLENYCITTLCQETVGEWWINLGFKYDYAVNNYYFGRY